MVMRTGILNEPAAPLLSGVTRRCILCGSERTRFFMKVCRESRTSPGPIQLELARCATCGLVFLVDPPPVDYDAEYLEEQGVLSTGAAQERFRLRQRVSDIARAVPPRPGVRLIDIGIGDGTFLHACEQAGYTTAGLDVNVEGVAIAKSKYALEADIRVDGLSAAFAGDRFDVIHLNEVIEHLPEPLEMLRWCREHIQTGGILVIQTGNIDSLVSRIKGPDWDYIRPYHVAYYSPRSISWALREARFAVERLNVVDWRVQDMFAALPEISADNGPVRAVRWLLFALSCKLPGARRTLLVRARPV